MISFRGPSHYRYLAVCIGTARQRFRLPAAFYRLLCQPSWSVPYHICCLGTAISRFMHYRYRVMDIDHAQTVNFISTSRRLSGLPLPCSELVIHLCYASTIATHLQCKSVIMSSSASRPSSHAVSMASPLLVCLLFSRFWFSTYSLVSVIR